MKQIFEEYGQMLIALLAAGAVFLVFSGTQGSGNGIGEISAGWIREQTEGYLADYSAEAFDAYAGGGGMSIEYINVPIVAGIRSLVCDHFRATPENGGPAEVSVCLVRDQQGQTYYTQKEKGKEYVYLEEAGIYTVCLMAEDSCGRQQYALLRIPVQRQ